MNFQSEIAVTKTKKNNDFIRISGTVQIETGPATVWAALHDAPTLHRCVTTGGSFEQVSPNVFSAKTHVKIGPTYANIYVTITIADLDPPHRAELSMTARGVFGHADATATILLEAEKSGTRLDYQAETNLKGALARIAGENAVATAKQLIENFFQQFAATLNSSDIEQASMPPLQEPSENTSASVRTNTDYAPSHSKSFWRKKGLWIGVGAAATAALMAVAAVALSHRQKR